MEELNMEMIEYVLEHKDVADKCLRELLIDTLNRIKELNVHKIDNDLEGLKKGLDFDVLFNSEEISLELFEQNKILMVLINIARTGIIKTFENLKDINEDKEGNKEFSKFLLSVLRMYIRYVKEKVALLNNEVKSDNLN